MFEMDAKYSSDVLSRDATSEEYLGGEEDERLNRLSLKRRRSKSTMTLAEWLLQILMHEDDEDHDEGDQLLLFGNQKRKNSEGLNLRQLLSQYVYQTREKDGSLSKYLVDLKSTNSASESEEVLNADYNDDEEEEGEGGDGKDLKIPSLTKRNNEEEELLLNMILGGKQ